jgi:ribonucleoside-triphosphate reductase
VLPEKLAKLHENGYVYIHDLDSYNLTINCLHLPTSKLLANGFNTGYGMINSPRSIGVAAELSCIMLQASQNDMFGGQSHPNFDNDLAPYVGFTRKKIKKQLITEGLSGNKLSIILEERTRAAVRQAMQAVVFNLNTMHSRAGSQVPFSSINIGIPNSKDAALICEEFLKVYSEGLGKGEQPIFPNIIFRVKKGVNREKNDPYYNLFSLACEVSSKRMNPTFMNIDADFNKKYYDKGILPATMGCRTYLISDVNGKPCVEGRGNNAPATINLPRIGMMSNHDIPTFFKILDERINDCVDILMHRFDVLKKLKVKDLPFVIGQHLMKGSENLNKDSSIEPVMRHGT